MLGWTLGLALAHHGIGQGTRLVRWMTNGRLREVLLVWYGPICYMKAFILLSIEL